MSIKKIKQTSEDVAQAYICSWCVQNSLIPVAVPNGFNLGAVAGIFKDNGLSLKVLNGINAKQIKLLKKEGLHTGFPDMMIFGNSLDKKNILFMENKVKNNKPSEIQLACHAWLRSLGFVVEISKDSIDAINKIKKYFGALGQSENKLYREARQEILKNVDTKQGS